MMRDPIGKVFTTSMTDECFRSHKSARVANQLVFLLKAIGCSQIFGMAKAILSQSFSNPWRKTLLSFGSACDLILLKTTAKVILPGEKRAFESAHGKRRLKGCV